ncbi:MAG: PIN domain-containing protein [Clostridiales bacterium]|nr:PIN domain-containing protein [Clostridiales bacterium]
MKILIDTNVILDVLFARDPFVADSITVLHMCEDDFAEAFVSAKTMADVYYFLRKQCKSEKKVRGVMQKIMSIVTVCGLKAQYFEDAFAMENDDFEDALQAACAKAEGCRLIISRNKKHYDGTGVKCLTPEEFVI